MRNFEDYQRTMQIKPTLLQAAKTGDLDSIKILASDLSTINKKDENGYSPLMYAAYYGHIVPVEYLISVGADVNSIDAGKNSILMGACFKGHSEVVEILLKKGADLHFKNQQGLTATDFARMFGRFELVQKLESKKTSKAIQLLKSLKIWVFYFEKQITKRSLK